MFNIPIPDSHPQLPPRQLHLFLVQRDLHLLPPNLQHDAFNPLLRCSLLLPLLCRPGNLLLHRYDIPNAYTMLGYICTILALSHNGAIQTQFYDSFATQPGALGCRCKVQDRKPCARETRRGEGRSEEGSFGSFGGEFGREEGELGGCEAGNIERARLVCHFFAFVGGRACPGCGYAWLI